VIAVLTLGLLVTAVAQWRASEKQAQSAEALQRLEYARSAPRFAFHPSESTPFSTPSKPGVIELPRVIQVTPIQGVASVVGLEMQLNLVASERGEAQFCRVFVRGLYEAVGRNLEMKRDVSKDFERLLGEFDRRNIDAIVPTYTAMVVYTDMMGQFSIRNIEIGRSDPVEVDPTPPDKAILYSGAWTGGSGFYFNEPGLPDTSCPRLAKKLTAAALATGGKPPDGPRVDAAIDSVLKRKGIEVPGYTDRNVAP
jgi:hypothetical protein